MTAEARQERRPRAGEIHRPARARWYASSKFATAEGLHARASAKFVQTVEKFDAEVRVTRCGESVNGGGGTSIMGLMMLAAAPGTTILVEATGNDAAAVMDALVTLINSRFGEED